MKVKFWGTQGSLPAPFTHDNIREKVHKALKLSQGKKLDSDKAIHQFIENELPFSVKGTYGSNTACVELINTEDEYILFDAGTGIRDFAFQHMKTEAGKKPATYHIIITHLHWDHIQGFPFFVPAYVPGKKIIIHGYHKDIEKTFREQMKSPVFPVDFDQLSADIQFNIMPECKAFEISGHKITSIKQDHPGSSYGYCFEKDGTKLVYSTDSEHKQNAYEKDYPFIEFFDSADLLIFDAQYTLAEATFTKANWGHSSNVIGVELAARSKVKKLAIFHHEPTTSDGELDDFLYNTQMFSNILHQESDQKQDEATFPKEIFLAYDGLELTL